MDWIRDVVLALLITSAAGSIVFLLWMAIVYAGGGMRNIRCSYWLLRGVLAGYLLSFVYLMVCQYIEYSRNQHDILSVATAPLDRMVFVFFFVWLVGGLVRIALQIHMRNYIKVTFRSRMDAPREYTMLLQRLCEELKIRKPVHLYRGYGVQTPFICGVRRPEIYLPVEEFPEEELEMILYHELVHYKQGDTFWKPVFGLVEHIYWFNPLSGLLWREAVRWTEANCDSYCCEKRFNTKKYFTLLLAMGTAEGIQENRYTPMWSEGGTELVWRISAIKRHFWKKTSIVFAAVLAVASILGGGIAAHAASQGVEMLYGQAYSITVEGTEEFLKPEEMLWYCMEYNPVVDEIFIRKRAEINQKSAEGFSIAGTVDWNVGARGACYSDGFDVGSGDDIKIRIAIQPSREEVQVGIVKPDGGIFYVTGANFISRTFSDCEAGTYKVFVVNTSRKKIVVNGTYMVRSDFSL